MPTFSGIYFCCIFILRNYSDILRITAENSECYIKPITEILQNYFYERSRKNLWNNHEIIQKFINNKKFTILDTDFEDLRFICIWKGHIFEGHYTRNIVGFSYIFICLKKEMARHTTE